MVSVHNDGIRFSGLRKLCSRLFKFVPTEATATIPPLGRPVLA